MTVSPPISLHFTVELEMRFPVVSYEVATLYLRIPNFLDLTPTVYHIGLFILFDLNQLIH